MVSYNHAPRPRLDWVQRKDYHGQVIYMGAGRKGKGSTHSLLDRFALRVDEDSRFKGRRQRGKKVSLNKPL